MKLVSVKALAGAAIFLAFFCALSCAGAVNYERKFPHMVANADPVSAGVIEAEFDKVLSSKLTKVQIEVVFYPRLNAAALEFRRELLQYRQFWDEDARRQFAAALELYREDYAARNLVDRYRKTRSVYGKVKGQVEWETFKFSRTRVAYPVIELGYRFKSEMPFLVTFMPSTREESEHGDSSSQEESQQISMYFTRAQADELVKLFDQSYLMALLQKPATPEPEPNEPTPATSYREWDG